MSDTGKGADKRRYPRVALVKRTVSRRDDAKAINGSLVDISVGGAAIEAQVEFEENLAIDLEIDDVGRYSGRMTRSFDDGFAVCFDLDEGEQEELGMEIERIRSTITDESY